MAKKYQKYAKFNGRLVMIGCGSIGQGVLPLILRHIDLDPKKITIVTADERGHEEARDLGIRFVKTRLTRQNFKEVLKNRIAAGDFLLNLSVEVSSLDLIEFCQRVGALYLDTCIEPWPGGYTDPKRSMSLRTNYAFREEALALKKKYRGGSTALVAHGANPGLVSHFIKRALLNIARDTKLKIAKPYSQIAWAELAQTLGIKVIHVAERDTQLSPKPKQPGEFVNTWSIDGFVSEGMQPAELGWGTHEKHFPLDGARHDFGCGAGIYLKRPGLSTQVRTWTPKEGPFHGFIITHNEAISVADYLTVRQGRKVVYRPTVHYAYHPCDQAILSMHETVGKNLQLPSQQRLISEEVVSGMDELGILLMGHKKGAYWYGSQLSIQEARKLAPYNNATSLQVTAPVLSGIIWALEHPKAGIMEADEVDFERNLEICEPYLGKLVGKYSDWTPLQGRGQLFPEDLDKSDPWQFKNFRVA